MSQTAPRLVSRFCRLQAWHLLLLALAGMGLLTGLAWQHFYSEARENAEADLAVIAELKARDVENWFRDKRNSTLQPVSGYLTTGLLRWQQAQRSPAADAALRERLAFYQQRHPEAIRVTLYDAQASFLISTDLAIHHDRHRLDVSRLNAAPVINQSEILDFHFEAKAGAHLAIISPLLDATPQGIRRVGYVLMELDPRRQLFRSIQRWPASSRSGESLLWQQQGDDVELVSPLRFEPDTLPGKRLPLSDLQASPAQLAARQPVSTPGKDYRQVEVLRYTHPVAGTNWWIVAKIDAKEVFAPALRNSLKFSALLLGLLAACCVLFIQYQRRALILAGQRQAEEEQKKLRAFIDAVPESLSMLHVDGQIVIANETAARRLGQTVAELVGQNVYSLLPPDQSESSQAAIREVCSSNKVIVLKDTRGDTEFLNMVYPLGDAQHVVIFATDITARSAAERARNAAINTLQSFIDHLPGTAFVKDHESRVLIANQGFQTLLGLNPADMIGKLSSEIFPGEFGEKIVADDLRILAAGQTEVQEEDFNGRFYESTKFVIPRDNAPPALGGITLDVTARHKAETRLRESETRLRNLTDNLPNSYLYQITVQADDSRKFTYISSGVERIHGISAAEILADANRLYVTIDPEQLAEVDLAERRSREEQCDFYMELRMRRADGQYGLCLVRSRPRPSQDGRLIWDGIVQDITDIKSKELELALHVRRAAALLELPKLGDTLDEAAFLAHTQDIAEQLTGSQIAFVHFVNDDQENIELAAWSHQTLSHYCTAGYDKHYPISQAGLWAEAARQKKPVVINDYASAPCKRGLPQGHSHLQRLISVPVMEADAVRMMAGVGNKATDYTDTDVESVQLIANEAWRLLQHRRQQTALQAREEHFRAFFERSMVGMATTSPDKGWIEVNDALCEILGYPREELVKLSWAELTHPDDIAKDVAYFERVLAGEINEYAMDKCFVRKDGQIVDAAIAARCIRKPDGSVNYFVALVEDISERKKNEREMALALETQRHLNQKLEEAHIQLLQTEKLAAIGQLAAGVAHELNNPIGFVHSNLGTLTEYTTALIELCDAYTTLIEDQHPECEQLAEIRRIKQDQDYDYLRSDIFPLLDESREGLIRVRKIVQDLRDFSRMGNQEWEAANLHKGIDSTLNIVANELKYKCTVVKQYGELPEVICVISQLNQVFLNLLVNAAQAIEKQGTITISTGVLDAEHIWVSIADTGQGIAPENLKRIFDPFFTTKPVGTGTGLGLALVFGIISRHHGRIEVSSAVGKGTAFRIILPVQQPGGEASA